MVDRLGPADAALLQIEDGDNPQHTGMVAICRASADGSDHATLSAMVAERLAQAPRYRQVVREVPARLANPVWVDDEAFDLSYHLRRSALPKPGTEQALHELVGRIMGRPLDRGRPLWQMYVIEGLDQDRVAILTKTHQALVDGVTTIDLGELIMGAGRAADLGAAGAPAPWLPARPPSSAALVVDALGQVVRQPTDLARAVRRGAVDLREAATGTLEVLGSVASVARAALRPAAGSPLSVRTGAQRLFTTVDTSLDDHRKVRAAHGGSVNDVVLATITGALRTWLQARGEPIRPGTSVRAVVPVSVQDAGGSSAAAVGSQVSSYVVDLPVGEPSAVMRLHQVGYATQAHKDTGRAVGADVLARLSGFAPPTLHAVGARVAGSLARRSSHLMITNVPGPQEPLDIAGSPLLATYPVLPIPKGQAVSIGLTSYDGAVHYGLNADRSAMPDVEILATCIADALAELVEAV